MPNETAKLLASGERFGNTCERAGKLAEAEAAAAAAAAARNEI